MIKKCKYCQSIILAKGGRKYCNVECKRKNSAKVTFTCELCGKEKTQYESEFKKSNYHYCSKACSNKFNLNPNQQPARLFDPNPKSNRKREEKGTIPLKKGYFDWARNYHPEIRKIPLTIQEVESKMFKITQDRYNQLPREAKLSFQI